MNANGPNGRSVVVVGGGVTGLGVTRDLAARGVDVTLLERGRLAGGTTGRMHGLLHSGARYAVDDATSARECAAENRVLRRVAPGAITETSGLFIALDEDDRDYVDEKLAACQECGIDVEVVDGEAARALEPALSSSVDRALQVPDAVVDPFSLSVATALDAERRGATVATGAEVVDVAVEDGAVTGVTVRGVDHSAGTDVDVGPDPGVTTTVEVDHVVNAAGAFAGRVADLAGVDVEMSPSRGVMTVVDTHVGTVVNRCRPRSQGDIAVPGEAGAILGTTDVPVADPESYPREDWEEALVVEELTPVLPEVTNAAVRRSYWGVRPVYDPDAGPGWGDPTDASRGHAVLDHRDRDDVAGLTTVVGGKLTTHRLMAEDVTDVVCDRLGVNAACRTADEPVPDDPDALADAATRYGLMGAVLGAPAGS
jgi:glycerol-3-phosphate dehydrogenase